MRRPPWTSTPTCTPVAVLCWRRSTSTREAYLAKRCRRACRLTAGVPPPTSPLGGRRAATSTA
eukprot:15525160-Heterocapsa_arctica.AAC.1